MTITVELTQADIGRAIWQYDITPSTPVHTYCPIAQALKRQFAEEHVSVGILTMTVGTTNYRVADSDEERVGQVTTRRACSWLLCKPMTFRITDDYHS